MPPGYSWLDLQSCHGRSTQLARDLPYRAPPPPTPPRLPLTPPSLPFPLSFCIPLSQTSFSSQIFRAGFLPSVFACCGPLVVPPSAPDVSFRVCLRRQGIDKWTGILVARRCAGLFFTSPISRAKGDPGLSQLPPLTRDFCSAAALDK